MNTLRLAAIGGVFLAQIACVKGSLDQMASPESVRDMRTIVAGMNLPAQVREVSQAMIDVGRANMDDGAWEALLRRTATRAVDDAIPALAPIVVTPAMHTRLVSEVTEAIRAINAQARLHDRTAVAGAIAQVIVTSLQEIIPEADRPALLEALIRTHSEATNTAIEGLDPFARVMSRNMALGFMDAAATVDRAPLSAFFAEQRAALTDAAAVSSSWWQTAFWVALAAAGAGLLALAGLAALLWRDVQLRRRNTRTLRFLAGALKARESDPAVREMLSSIADPTDPSAASHLRDFYDEHPELRLHVRIDPDRPQHPQG